MERYTFHIQYHESWTELFEKWNDILHHIEDKLNESEQIDKIYPPPHQIFRVFDLDVNEIKILFMGMDPYHNQGEAMGLSFSVNSDIKIPPSLRNIYKELQLEFPERNYCFQHGDLTRWFYEEKIFLLNSALTVYENSAGSHMKLWEKFTDDVISYISRKNEQCIYLLLGNHAKKKKIYIQQKDRIIEGVHPSPLSASRGFFGSGIFQQIENKIGGMMDWRN